MLFNSLQFLGFFCVVYPLYLVLRHRYQNLLILAASYYFYGCWDWRFLGLMLFSTVMDYGFGLAVHRTERGDRRRKAMLITSIAVNLGLLFAFKYFNFFAEGLNDLLGVFKLGTSIATLKVILPVGISFYTFHNISYIVDVYQGKLEPTRSLINFAAYVAYFPQLVAGPIARAGHLLPQVEKPRTITYAAVREGLWLILFGYFKKMVVADNMIPFTQSLFSRPAEHSGLEILIGLYAFAFQIYGDFSGYTDIARGICKLMGFELIVNFRKPYFAVNPSDFWQRWHISLSTWLRDYLYIPLGGNRHGEFKTYRNLLITMLLGGLWHGASWHFVAWGAFHGGLLVAHRMLSGSRVGAWLTANVPASVWGPVARVGFFHITCLGWLLFAVQSLTDVPHLLRALAGPLSHNGQMALITLLVFAGPLVMYEWCEERSGKPNLVKHWSPGLRLACYVLVFASVVLAGVVEKHEFIYFQF